MKCALCGKEENVFHGIDGHAICNSCLHKIGDNNPLTISLRDHFAGQALAALANFEDYAKDCSGMTAAACYKYADAMLEARGE
jgi:hypothetical protein